VDLQNDFADPRGALYVKGAEEVVRRATRRLEVAEDEEALVVYTQDWHPPRTSHFVTGGGVWPVHCVAGSWGAGFATGVRIAGPVVRKGVGGEDGYSGFFVRDPATGVRSSTGLGELLRRHGVEQVLVLGLATDYCVKETALDACGEGFAVSVLVPAVAAVDLEPGDGERALAELASHGVQLVDE
jgi:nicotinamidase/pyrazinamidase